MRYSGRATVIAGAMLLVVAGCAPAQLGDIQRTGKGPLLQRDTYGTAELTSKGEKMTLQLKLASGATCDGQFTLKESVSSWPIIGGMMGKSEAYLVYQGKWAADQSADCLKALNGPGGQERQVNVYDTSLGVRNVFICNDAPGGLVCSNSRIYSIDK